MRNEAEMIEFEQDRRMVVKILDAPAPVEIVIDFTPVDGGTRLDWTGIFSPRGILAPTAPLMARFYRMVVREGPEEPQGPDGPRRALVGSPMVPDRAYFAVQRQFAERWADVASVPIETAYLECTTWYLQAAGLGREFDPDHPTWQKLVAEVRLRPIPMAWSTRLPCGTSRMCRRDRSSIGPGRRTIGAVRIHFFGERSSDRTSTGAATPAGTPA